MSCNTVVPSILPFRSYVEFSGPEHVHSAPVHSVLTVFAGLTSSWLEYSRSETQTPAHIHPPIAIRAPGDLCVGVSRTRNQYKDRKSLFACLRTYGTGIFNDANEPTVAGVKRMWQRVYLFFNISRVVCRVFGSFYLSRHRNINVGPLFFISKSTTCYRLVTTDDRTKRGFLRVRFHLSRSK